MSVYQYSGALISIYGKKKYANFSRRMIMFHKNLCYFYARIVSTHCITVTWLLRENQAEARIGLTIGVLIES